MPADVAVAQRAQHGIAERVNDDVAVRVRNHALWMRDPHTAQHDVIAFAEGMHVESLSDSHRHLLRHL